MNLIALSAKARCGKDTAALYISNFNHLNTTTYALAACFKDSIAQHFSTFFSHEDVFGLGVDRNTELFYIDQVDFIKRTKMVFLDFGHDLDKIDIDWSSVTETENSWTIRRIMQTIGTDIGCNQVDKMVWVKVLDKALEKMEKVYDTVIITDCRQDHEMVYMRSLGAKVLHILRDTGIEDTHETEKGLPIGEGDYVIENNGTMNEYFENLDRFVDTLTN